MKYPPNLAEHKTRITRAVGAFLFSVTAASCLMGPKHVVPEMNPPANFKTTGIWKVAAPKGDLSKGEWWRMFGDAELNRLEQMVASHNPTLEGAIKRVEQSRAIVAEGRSGLVPQISIGTNVTQLGTSSNSPGFRPGQTLTFWRAPIAMQYEVDLWGRIRSGIESGKAGLAAAEALRENTLLSLQADLAIHYLLLRALDREKGILDEGVQLRQRTLGLVEKRFEAGDVAELDVVQARTELAEAQSEAIMIERTRMQRENAIAVLSGQMPSMMKLRQIPLRGEPPAVRGFLPSHLLERRPDIAAAERMLAEANAEIGVARAAFFPQVRFNLTSGLESAVLNRLVESNSILWSLGAEIEQPLIDGGLRRARQKRALALRDEMAAGYKETVLRAFQDVEDALAALHVLGRQAVVQADAARSARRMLELAEKQYEAGLVSYFEVVNAQRTALRAEQSEVQTQGSRFEAVVLLVRALGGQW